MNRKPRQKPSAELQKRRMELLMECPEPNDVMIEDRGTRYKMAVKESLYATLQFRNIGSGRPQSDEEMIEILEGFFKKCAELGQIPSVEKACVALGMSITELRKIRDGVLKGFSPKTKDIIKEVYTICGAITGDLAMRNEINGVVYIFMAKNHFDLSDKQEVVVTPNNTLEATTTVDAITAKYEELPDE